MLTVVNGNDESQVLDAAIMLAVHTQGWKNIIRYRELCFDQYFGEALKGLNSTGWAVTLLSMEMSKVYTKGMEHAAFFSFSDGGLLSNLTDKAATALCTQGRKSALSSLNEFRRKAENFISENRSALYQANSLISRWNVPSFDFKDVIHGSDFDLNNSTENEDWGDQFEHYYRQVEEALNAFSQACNDATEQLELFRKGNFDQSILKLREQKHAEHQRQQQLEKLEKQSVTIMKDGKEHFFSIEWQQVENPPCDPDSISHIKTDGKIWLIVAKINSDEVFYRSDDGVHWLKVQLDMPDIKIWFDGVDVVNGVWIIKNRALAEGTRDEGFYYSTDATTWRHSPEPEPSKRRLSINDGHMFFENIFYFNGLWLWCGHQFKKYNYTEKGFFSDSTKTDSYRKIVLYCAQTLDGPWQLWDQTPQLSEGVEVKTICSLPGKNSILAFCEYDSSFIRNKKRPETPPFVMYFGSSKKWRECIWGGSKSFYSSNELSFFQISDRLMCFHDGEILSSDKGYDWSLQENENLAASVYFPLKTFDLLTSRHYGGSVIYLSQDAKLFKELRLEEGAWRYLTANEEGIVGVYYANKHEETVLRIGHYICQAKI